MSKDTCLILLPRGTRRMASGRSVDFDLVYNACVLPALADCSLTLVRPNLDLEGRVLDEARLALLSRVVLCIADLTLLDPFVLYQVGIRHAMRSSGTLLMYADSVSLSVANVNDSACVYRVAHNGSVADIAAVRDSLSYRIKACLEGRDDSPLAGSAESMRAPALAGSDEREAMQAQFAAARADEQNSVGMLLEFEKRLTPVIQQYPDVACELFLTYRRKEAWAEMGAMFERLPETLRTLPSLQEQYALALNRAGETASAEAVLQKLLNQHGGTGDTYGVLGRMYKDQWEAARFANQDTLATGFLDKAIEAYMKGFEADWRDPYAGINAVTLMEIREPPDPRRDKILPVVSYAAQQRIRSGTKDYWDFATLLEAAVLGRDQETASRVLVDAVGASREAWQAKSTARNLRLIREARENRRERKLRWAVEIEEALERKASS